MYYCVIIHFQATSSIRFKLSCSGAGSVVSNIYEHLSRLCDSINAGMSGNVQFVVIYCICTRMTFPFVLWHRFLLTAVAALSSYSIHLLLKASGIVGKPCVKKDHYTTFTTCYKDMLEQRYEV